MKNTILLPIITFVAGLSCGYFFLDNKPEEVNSPIVESPEVPILIPSDTDHLKEIALLKEEILQLKLALAQKEETQPPEQVERQIKKDLIQSIINGEKISSKQAELDRNSFLRKVKGLNLTPDQMSVAEQLWEKYMQQMRLITQTRGLISENEQREQFPDLYNFNFDFELQKILAKDQNNEYKENMTQEMTGIGNMLSAAFFADYGISTDSGFSENEQFAIQKAVTTAYSYNGGKLKIPQPILDLNLSPLNERVLASCYQNLPEELFLKIYQQMVNKETETP